MVTYVLIFLVIMCPKDAWGYLDPGTGSYIVQVILAVIAGWMLTVKLFWKKIRAYLSRLNAKHSTKERDKR